MKLKFKQLFVSLIIGFLLTACVPNPDSTNSLVSESESTSTSETINYPLVTFRVSLPMQISAGSKVKIAGNFNDWSPFAEGYELTKSSDNMYVIELSFETAEVGQIIKYKYVLLLPNQVDEPWANVEGGAKGEEISDRTYKLISGAQTKTDTVAAFKNNIGKTSLTRGKLEIITLTMSQYEDQRTRKVRIWTPDGYEANGSKNYPVLYMHDGQNLFDSYTGFSGEWKIDEAIGTMMDQGYQGAIVVGIDNGVDRLNELTVNWPLSSSGSSNNIKPSGENYAAFIVETVKPYIDSNYKTDASAASTYIGGSSLGGVMSFYLTLTYPEVFGKSLLFSTSMWIYQTGTIANVINGANLGSITNKPKIYVYGGGAEGSNIAGDVANIYSAFINIGYSDQMIKKHVEPGKGHNEDAWALHFPIAFNWLKS